MTSSGKSINMNLKTLVSALLNFYMKEVQIEQDVGLKEQLYHDLFAKLIIMDLNVHS